jgi:hypothetical protein
MDLFLWLDSNSLVSWLKTTSWVYPWVLSFHSIGMGFLVGVIFMIGLRVVGFGRYAIAPLERFLLVVRIAFTVSLVTGVILFVIDAERFFYSPTFRVKLLLIVLGGVSGWFLARMVFAKGTDWVGTGEAPQATKLVAAVTLVCWTGAITAGRLTAYLP